MTFEALQKQLIREFRASPAKAIALVVLFGVGLWFWVPMIVRPLQKPDSATPPAETTAAAPTSTPTTTATNTAAAPAKSATGAELVMWQDTAERMDRDRRMQSAAHPQDARNPFAHPMAEAAEQEIANKPAPALSIKITPRDLGMSVSSIALGPGGRTAMINGETYREGASIDAGDGIAFDLVKVFPRRVLLAHNGDEFELAAETEHVSGIRKRKP